MPIYEFYCSRCHTIFNFFSKSVNTTKIPHCPRCKTQRLDRQVSLFAVTGKAKESSENDELPFDEGKLEQAMQMLAGEADKIKEDDPRQAAALMRKLSDMTGIELGSAMHEALDRMEKGENPEKIEEEMGESLESEEPFLVPGKKAGRPGLSARPPLRDETLYDL
ncbi:MAG: zinc ribbon domain-containing protein [Desulfobacterales bacterium]|nr:zinc ribbon domain-containing protein [Desulfobacterales bacterium]